MNIESTWRVVFTLVDDYQVLELFYSRNREVLQ